MKRTSRAKIEAATLDPDDAPPLTEEFWKNAEYRIANKKVTKAEWAHAVRAQLEADGVSIDELIASSKRT